MCRDASVIGLCQTAPNPPAGQRQAMTQRIALVSNALAFAGPPAVTALRAAGYQVLVQDGQLRSGDRIDAFEAAHPGVRVIPATTPETLVEVAWSMVPRIDVVVSNDVHPAIGVRVEEATPAQLQDALDALVIWPFRLLRAAVPRLRMQGRGNVILITSCRTELPQPGGAIPDMARAAANALVHSLAIELAPYGIPVNAIAPNYLYSEAYFPRARFIDDPQGAAFVRQAVPAGRLGEPGELGELLLYLANMQGSFHTGTVIKFAGGWPVSPARPE